MCETDANEGASMLVTPTRCHEDRTQIVILHKKKTGIPYKLEKN